MHSWVHWAQFGVLVSCPKTFWHVGIKLLTFCLVHSLLFCFNKSWISSCVRITLQEFFSAFVMSLGEKLRDTWSSAIWFWLVSAVLPVGYRLYQTATCCGIGRATYCVPQVSNRLSEFQLNFELHYHPCSLEVSPELLVHWWFDLWYPALRLPNAIFKSV